MAIIYVHNLKAKKEHDVEINKVGAFRRGGVDPRDGVGSPTPCYFFFGSRTLSTSKSSSSRL